MPPSPHPLPFCRGSNAICMHTRLGFCVPVPVSMHRCPYVGAMASSRVRKRGALDLFPPCFLHRPREASALVFSPTICSRLALIPGRAWKATPIMQRVATGRSTREIKRRSEWGCVAGEKKKHAKQRCGSSTVVRLQTHTHTHTQAHLSTHARTSSPSLWQC